MPWIKKQPLFFCLCISVGEGGVEILGGRKIVDFSAGKREIRIERGWDVSNIALQCLVPGK